MQIARQDVTVAEIAANSLAAVRVFEKYGIDYCCGGKRPLAEVCRKNGEDPEKILAEVEAALAGFEGTQRDWNTAPLRELTRHIVSVHHAYLWNELPAIQARLDKVYRVYNQRYGPSLIGLPEAYADLRSELELHMRKEERILFPAIEAAEASHTAAPFLAAPIHVMEAEHESAGLALGRIREITQDFTVPEYGCVTYQALMRSLAELEQDLHLHIHLENNILFPRTQQLSGAGTKADGPAGCR